eukprot:TRINITY_DN22_c0_g3_i4.p1 TRINITY_DN22_c0_g3~~TRINITY_DN22_c0_g3_i4.p1  ORF type:complete len:519 (-),score=68.60 TRINITY_DN22_c0_g3_i4:206-1711(-)
MESDCAQAAVEGQRSSACAGDSESAECAAIRAEIEPLLARAKDAELAEERAGAEIDGLRDERATLICMCEQLFGLVVGSSGFAVPRQGRLRPCKASEHRAEAAEDSVSCVRQQREAALRNAEASEAALATTQRYLEWLQSDIEILRQELDERPVRRLSLSVGARHPLRMRQRADDELFHWDIRVSHPDVVSYEESANDEDGIGGPVRELLALSPGVTAVTVTRRRRVDANATSSLSVQGSPGQHCRCHTWLPPEDSLVIHVYDIDRTLTPTPRKVARVETLKSFYSFDGCESMDGADTTDRLREVLMRGNSKESVGFAMTPNWSAGSFSFPEVCPTPLALRGTSSNFGALRNGTPICSTPLCCTTPIPISGEATSSPRRQLSQSCGETTLNGLAEDASKADAVEDAAVAQASNDDGLEQVAAQFRHHDPSGRGVIQRGDLVKLLQVLNGAEWTDARVDRLLRVAESSPHFQFRYNAASPIVYDEFLRWLFDRSTSGDVLEP